MNKETAMTNSMTFRPQVFSKNGQGTNFCQIENPECVFSSKL